MRAVSALDVRVVDQLREEPLPRSPEHRRLVPRIHPMAMEFDEDPVGSILNRHGRPTPEPQAVHGRRVERPPPPPFETRAGPAPHPPTQDHAEGAPDYPPQHSSRCAA